MRVVDCMTDDDKTFEELLKHIDSLRKAIASAPGVSAQAVSSGLLPLFEIVAQKVWTQQKEIAAIKQLLADRGIVRGPGL